MLHQAAVIEHTLPVAQQSTASGDPLAAKMQMEASLVCVRALLTKGRDADALQLAKQVLTALLSWLLTWLVPCWCCSACSGMSRVTFP